MSRKVKFGVRIHQGGYSYESLRQIWTTADRLGYHSATLYDLLNAPALECWTTLSALATETQRIRLTPLVLANPYRSPALVAKMSSTLDVISKGRLELGIGAGGDRHDHLASGYEFPAVPQRVEMLEEALAVIKALWTEPATTFTGRHYALKEAANEPKPVQRPGPPLLVGGHGETHFLRAVAQFADISNVGFEMSLKEHRSKAHAVEAYCHAVGRDPSEIEVSHNTRVMVAPSRAEFDRITAQRSALLGMSAREFRKSIGRAITGTPEECAGQLDRYVEEGITYFFLLFPEPVSGESLELFAREVVPHFDVPD